jgi:hypothetical protein
MFGALVLCGAGAPAREPDQDSNGPKLTGTDCFLLLAVLITLGIFFAGHSRGRGRPRRIELEASR